MHSGCNNLRRFFIYLHCKQEDMSRELERVRKMFVPDGYDEGTPYWILPSDRITYDYKEWLSADKAYWKDKEE